MQHDFILLDRSSSMSAGGRWPEALAAVNSYVADLAAKNVDTGVTLVTFDKPAQAMAFETVRDRITPQTWQPVTDAEISPRGWTPLNDAVGRIVGLAKQGFNGTPYDKVALIVITDGEENASQEFNHQQAKALLDECRAKGWQVLFIGADYDNSQQAAGYGTVAAQYVQSSVGNLRQTMSYAAAGRSSYGLTGQAMEFTEQQKEALKVDPAVPPNGVTKTAGRPIVGDSTASK